MADGPRREHRAFFPRNRRWLEPVIVALVVLLAMLALAGLSGCGAVPRESIAGPAPVPSATPAPPSAFTSALAFGYPAEHRARLTRATVGQCFTLQIAPAFSADEVALIYAASRAVTGATSGDVTFSAGCSYSIHIDKDGAHRLVDGTPVTGYAGLAYMDAVDGRMTGGRVIVNPDWVRSKVVMHELLHVVGFMHPGLPGSVMSDLAIDSTAVAPVDAEAWRWMRSAPLGFPGPFVSSTSVGRRFIQCGGGR